MRSKGPELRLPGTQPGLLGESQRPYLTGPLLFPIGFSGRVDDSCKRTGCQMLEVTSAPSVLKHTPSTGPVSVLSLVGSEWSFQEPPHLFCSPSVKTHGSYFPRWGALAWERTSWLQTSWVSWRRTSSPVSPSCLMPVSLCSVFKKSSNLLRYTTLLKHRKGSSCPFPVNYQLHRNKH